MKLRWKYRPKNYNLSKYGHIIRMKNAEIARLVDALQKGLQLFEDSFNDPCMCDDDYKCRQCKIDDLWNTYFKILETEKPPGE